MRATARLASRLSSMHSQPIICVSTATHTAARRWRVSNAQEAAQLLEVTLGHWVAFGVMVAVLLALDLFVFHRQDHEPSLRESAGWTVFWASLALAFAGLLWWWAGRGPAID